MTGWVHIVWPMVAGVCLAFALLYLFVWIRRRSQLEYVCLAISAGAVSAFTIIEFLLMSTASIAAYESLLRWIHIPGFLLVVSLILFVRLHLGAGRWWLAGTVVALRLLILVLIYGFGLNVHYDQLVALREFDLLFGSTVQVVDWTYNPLSLIDDASVLLMLVFVIGAAVSTWRSGERRGALVVPAAIVVFAALAGVHLSLIYLELLQSPFVVGMCYLPVIVAAGGELARDVLDAAELTDQLKVREVELTEMQQRMAMAADAARMGMWVWDICADRFWSTDGALALFGMPPNSRPSLTEILAAIHPDERPVVQDAIKQAMNQREVVNVEYRTISTPDSVCWVASRGLVEFDDDGQPLRMRGVSVDITERKTAELEASHMHAEIAHLSRVTMLGELSGSIAHELNQPLAAILSNAEAAESMLESNSADPAELREMLADIVEQDIRAGEVIRRLRSLLKKGEVEARPLDVNDLVREAIVLARNDLINRGVNASQELAEGLPAVCADRVQLQQVLLNLVVNACEAMVDVPGSQRMLTVRTGQDEQGLVRICVIDRGQGIPEDQREAVFDPFHTTKATGMGLGLSVSRTIVEAHGGRIWAQANPVQGTQMCVALPASQGGNCESVAIDSLPGR